MKQKNSSEQAIRAIEGPFESILEDLWDIFTCLMDNLLCNVFIIDHPEYMLSFPYRSANPDDQRKYYGKLGGYHSYPKEGLALIDEYKQKTKDMTDENLIYHLASMEEINEKVSNMITKADIFEPLDIKNKESFFKLCDYCYVMILIIKKALKKIKPEEKKTPRKISGVISFCVFQSMDLLQIYFELHGYWTRIMEERAKKRDSGKGQKDAKQKRVKKLSESITKFVNDHEKDVLHIDKAAFHKMLCDTFIGTESYPRHPQTIKLYKESVEQELGKKIKLVKKVPL